MYRRAARIYRRPNAPYMFKQVVSKYTIDINPGNNPTTAGYGFSFKADDISQWDTFLALYDEFMLAAVKVRFIPSCSNANASQGAALVHVAVDFDDAIVPTTEADVLQRPFCRSELSTRNRKFYFKPKWTLALRQTESSSNFKSAARRGFIDMNSGNLVEHYGLKVWLNYIEPITVDHKIRILCTYYVMFRNVR